MSDPQNRLRAAGTVGLLLAAPPSSASQMVGTLTGGVGTDFVPWLPGFRGAAALGPGYVNYQQPRRRSRRRS
jgi:hypothetical protein